LVHPENPLHQDGVTGASMFIGTFHDGQRRLLFSSAQVDYVRYWLLNMGLTKEPIPLPYSECLLTPEEFATVSPVTYPDGGSLRNAVKVYLLQRRVIPLADQLFQEYWQKQ
jgi:hypothetical protein